jgi:hypothetical protein
MMPQVITFTIGAQLGEGGELTTLVYNPQERAWATCYCCSNGTHCCRPKCCGGNFVPTKAIYSTMRVTVDDDGRVVSIESVGGECQSQADGLGEPAEPRFHVAQVDA